MWDWFIQFLTQVLETLAGATGDWGLAVIILTFVIRLLIMPLMTKSTASTARMQVLQPKLTEIQERYADDPERQMEEMRKFQAENNFNPLSGCLPMFLQMPIFFALFTVARNVPANASFFNILPSISMSASEAFAAGGIEIGAALVCMADIVEVEIVVIPCEARPHVVMYGMHRALSILLTHDIAGKTVHGTACEGHFAQCTQWISFAICLHGSAVGRYYSAVGRHYLGPNALHP